ncbi:MAG: DNA cytosine methyltransferase [Moraxella sp.]|nr:DNA cytosine methyltransferase [Moraxella sp.]
MKFLSLFSGIEACSVAWKDLGWECVGFSEIEPFPCSLLAHHYPNVPNLGDVTKITEQQIKDLGKIDLVVFGSPCQNLSVAGNRQGLQGQSSGLFYDAIRIIRWARVHGGARFALWENVPGAFSSNKGDDFREVVRALSGCKSLDTPENGWGNSGVAVGENGLTEWRVLDAQYFGLAQRRKRVFALTDFGDWQDRPPVLFEQDCLSGNPAPSRETGQNPTTNAKNGVREICDDVNAKKAIAFQSAYNNVAVKENITPPILAAQGTTGNKGVYVCHSEPIFFEQRYDDKPVVIAKGVAPTLTAGMGTAGTNHIYTAYTVHADPTPKVSENVSGTLISQGGGGIVPPNVVYGFDNKQNTPTTQKELSPTLAASGCKEPVGVIAGNIIGRCDDAGGNGAGVQENISYTLTATDRHAVITDFVVRRLTPVECERLQGFHDNYTNIPFKGKPAANSPRYKALGNSMAVPVMRWIGERIVWALNQPKINLG